MFGSDVFGNIPILNPAPIPAEIEKLYDGK